MSRYSVRQEKKDPKEKKKSISEMRTNGSWNNVSFGQKIIIWSQSNRLEVQIQLSVIEQFSIVVK